jgi:hypothetical protein
MWDIHRNYAYSLWLRINLNVEKAGIFKASMKVTNFTILNYNRKRLIYVKNLYVIMLGALNQMTVSSGMYLSVLQYWIFGALGYTGLQPNASWINC